MFCAIFCILRRQRCGRMPFCRKQTDPSITIQLSTPFFARKIEHYVDKDRFYDHTSGEPLTFPASMRENARYFEH